MADHRGAAQSIRRPVVLGGEFHAAVGHLSKFNGTLTLATNPRARKRLVPDPEHAQELGPHVTLLQGEQHDEVRLAISVDITAGNLSTAHELLHAVPAECALLRK